MKTLELGSGSCTLTITSEEMPEPLYWRVILRSGGLSASTDIDLDAVRHTEEPIGDFFADLAANCRGMNRSSVMGASALRHILLEVSVCSTRSPSVCIVRYAPGLPPVSVSQEPPGPETTASFASSRLRHRSTEFI
jgi:hypothetical protein